MTPAEQQELIDEIVEQTGTVASVETAESIVDELT